MSFIVFVWTSTSDNDDETGSGPDSGLSRTPEMLRMEEKGSFNYAMILINFCNNFVSMVNVILIFT